MGRSTRCVQNVGCFEKNHKMWLIVFVAISLLVTLWVISCGGDKDSDSDLDDDDSGEGDGNNDVDPGSPLICEGEVCTDPDTGLMWQNGNGFGGEWEGANNYCTNLDRGGYKDWRLPTVSELRSLIRGCPATRPGGSCGVTDSCLEDDCWNDPCDGCEPEQGPGLDGLYAPSELSGDGWEYWTSDPVPDQDERVWYINFRFGNVFHNPDSLYTNARCVRHTDTNNK